MHPDAAWNFTLIEYLHLIKCDNNTPQVDPSKMTQKYIRELEERHEENRRKRLAKQNGQG
jgi:hypothetical protein